MKNNDLNQIKQQMLDQNEQQYGSEIREKYGSDTVDASNKKFMGMSPEQFAESERLSGEYFAALKAAFEQGDHNGELAQRACELHAQWLQLMWPDGMYSGEAHLGLAQMYCDDPRFRAYYEKIASNCPEFFRDAIGVYVYKFAPQGD